MTVAKAYEADEMYTIEIEGHAGYNPGNDIVCSAVSTLIQTFAASAENHVGGSTIVACELGSGHAKVSIKGCSALYRSCVLGLTMIGNSYPDNLRVI